eukprot:1732254-Amphidinium_carterae.1
MVTFAKLSLGTCFSPEEFQFASSPTQDPKRTKALCEKLLLDFPCNVELPINELCTSQQWQKPCSGTAFGYIADI